MPEHSVDEFRQACGAAGPLTLSVEGPDHPDGREVIVESPSAVLGSQPRADVHLPGEAVGNRHAYLQVIAGRVFCLEIDDECRCSGRTAHKAPAGWIRDRPSSSGRTGCGWSAACAGRQAASPRGGGQPDQQSRPEQLNPLAAGSADRLGAPDATLEIVRHRTLQARWPLDRLLSLVGRNPVCKVRIHKASVSRVHLRVVRTADGTWLIDLLSEGGVRVNGERVSIARLGDADRIQIRDVLIRARFAPTPLAVLPAPPSADCGLRIADSKIRHQDPTAIFQSAIGGAGRPRAGGAAVPSGRPVQPDAAADVRAVPAGADADVPDVHRPAQ